ncbi:MAG: SNF2-related protein [Bacteroidota bacterium]
MKVSSAQPFQIIYSLYEHEFLGYMFESFVVHLDDKGKLTFQHQNISSKNACEFSSGLDETDYELIGLMDTMHQDVVVRKFTRKNMKTNEFFLKTYDEEKGNPLLQKEIENYLETRRSKILEMLKGKMVFEMGNDGEPAWKQLEVMEERATVLFHFRRNDDNTHYFPTIKHQGEKLDFQYKGAYIICQHPAWMVLGNKIYSFEKEVDGKKLIPFLNKKFIVIPKNVEETYYNKFVAPLIASFDVSAKGFEINSEQYDPIPILSFTELAGQPSQPISLFDNGKTATSNDEGKILFDLTFKYGDFKFKGEFISPISVSVEKNGDEYIFHKVRRKVAQEKKLINFLIDRGLQIKGSKLTLSKPVAFSWINQHSAELKEMGFSLHQKEVNGKRYFLGDPSINIEVRENIDWFDINAIIKFGEFEIPFKDLRKYILKKKAEFKLPNGEYAVIPADWFDEYSELFAFADENSDSLEGHTLKKYHIALIQELETSNLAKVQINRKLNKLRGFGQIDDYPTPERFKGELRPYQKAGYNWLQFLAEFRFGGCLADDMGLGKTVQTLALLQSQKEKGNEGASLLIMPTSLVYNWEMEAQKFTPDLKTFTYTGTQRKKDIEQFNDYDIIITSYGITRLDIELLSKYYFNYVILDESQAIKNPGSNIAKAVAKLNSRFKLILTGTPLENSTMDLWSQMNFVNPGLLGTQSFFKNEFLNPIEKKSDESKTRKLYSMIKPFILRRHKSQVATELPEKVEYIQYSTMSTDQEQKYEEVKSFYRNKILEQIESKGLKNSQFLLLQGLTKLRQIANHPSMTDEEYQSDSGKMEDVINMLENGIGEGHKILVFSQFVKHLGLFSRYLKENNIDFAYLDGSTKDRKSEVERFQNEAQLKVFLISLKAGGLGLNLTKADYVFLLDPWWNPAIEAQAIDRAHRIGQENKVFTYKFISKNTVEEKILALQQKKMKLASELVTTEESFMKTLSKEDIENLLA